MGQNLQKNFLKKCDITKTTLVLDDVGQLVVKYGIWNSFCELVQNSILNNSLANIIKHLCGFSILLSAVSFIHVHVYLTSHCSVCIKHVCVTAGYVSTSMIMCMYLIVAWIRTAVREHKGFSTVFSSHLKYYTFRVN